VLQKSDVRCIARLTMRTTTPPTLLLSLLLAATGCATTTKPARAPKPGELEALTAVGAKAPGLIVWTSARAGLPHIFAMRTDGADVRQLTKGDFTDWNPRLSPDGAKVLFARGKAEGFVRESQASDAGTWDLYVVGADGRGVGQEVEDATWGSWISNDEILFQRGAQILRKKIGAEEETTVLETSGVAAFAGSVVSQPRLSPNGHFLALTLTGAHRQVGVWRLKKKLWSPIGEGSQIEWAPDGASVTWVGTEGREFGEIDRVAVAHGERVATKAKAEDEGDDEGSKANAAKNDGDRLFDAPGARSREFFPRLSSDGKWLVFGAAKGGAEHDVEDFEIYLWEVGTPPESAVRMTFDPASDRWPDLFVGAPPAAAPPADAAAKKDEAPAPETAAPEEAAAKSDEKAAEKTDAAKDGKAEKAGTGEKTEMPASEGENAAPAAEEEAAPAEAKAKGKAAKPKAKGKAKKKARTR
jgi:hypothetical protein